MSLTEMIKEEYDSDVVNGTKDAQKFYDFLNGITKELSVDKQNECAEVLANLEFSFFTQGFIRGIATAKSGLI